MFLPNDRLLITTDVFDELIVKWIAKGTPEIMRKEIIMRDRVRRANMKINESSQKALHSEITH